MVPHGGDRGAAANDRREARGSGAACNGSHETDQKPMLHYKNVMFAVQQNGLSLCLSQGGFVWVSLIHFQSPRHHSMSRRPIMLLRKRTILAIAFAGAFTGV